MRIYANPLEAAREVERDLWEMGLDVHPQTMQDKNVAKDPDYLTKEVQAYGFKIHGWQWDAPGEAVFVNYVLTGKNDGPAEDYSEVMKYIEQEHDDRTSGMAMNPGNSYKLRPKVWDQFLKDGHFAYTYSERMTPQLLRILQELEERPETRQGIINLHSNICPTMGMTRVTTGSLHHVVQRSADMMNMGGGGRIPCSMYYQVMLRNGKVDLIYTMRSCDFLTHFPVDIALALRLQSWFAEHLKKPTGDFTYFTGSLHAYAKDMKHRGIF
jgi:thymidylate synthase